MASQDNTTTFPHPPTIEEPSQVANSEAGDVESILSSRMTDIASEDGSDQVVDPALGSNIQQPGQRRSVQTNASRPTTGMTGVSNQRSAWSQAPASRRGHVSMNSTARASVSTTAGPRPKSGRSHAPSLTSHAFFRPMSSQRLQAQRGGSRPPPLTQQAVTESLSQGGGVVRSNVNQNQAARLGDDLDGPAPPSRGTEMTDQETMERVTATTSPTRGHYPTGSLTDSVRPLQRGLPNPGGLSIAIDKSYQNGNGLAIPSKSPRSFRSSFLLPNRGDITPGSPNRSSKGREKLSSIASSPGLTSVDPSKNVHKKVKLGSNYEYFTGNTIFFWGGRIQNTRHRPINIATGLLFVVPGALFFVFSAPWLWHNISPAIPIVFAYLYYLAFSSFIHASISDPGILPRNLHPMPPPEENEDPLRLAPPTNDWTMIKSAQSATAAMEVPTKYCKTCNIWRPARGHHCRICDNCIETQDHHCVWINNCVGRRNYRYFFTFVTTGTLVSLYLLGASLTQILVYMKRQNISFGAAIDHFRVPFAMVIYGALGTPYLLALMVYHLFLMGRGETTREYLNSHKFLKKDRHRPFTQGSVIKNWLVVLCRPRPPTYLNFKREYEEGDQRFGERKGKRTAPLVKEVQGKGVAMEMQDVAAAERGFQGPTALRGGNGNGRPQT
ncbi:related to ERF2-protein involved in palmitoylation and localization of Ras2p [Rhynchosporium agropyri]|uniref:Palmitoyltransferase n=1 Tax=Rhynchosporium agropyri TaxID=914238 RepID=A0A1E1K1I7_9HELO|nr:related to ERF2-protein involved in palmitoylation and localization of Ras2p [Rhynchosporium agropyri]